MVAMIEQQLPAPTISGYELAELCIDAVLPLKGVWEDEYVPSAKRSKVVETARRRVAFADDAEVFEWSYSEENIKNAWYCRGEYAKFKLDCAKTVKALQTSQGNSSQLDHSACCLRGLEDLLVPQMSLTKKQRRRYILRAVLLQQSMQRKSGQTDPELISALSERISRKAAGEAQLLGNLDAERATQLR